MVNPIGDMGTCFSGLNIGGWLLGAAKAVSGKNSD